MKISRFFRYLIISKCLRIFTIIRDFRGFCFIFKICRYFDDFSRFSKILQIFEILMISLFLKIFIIDRIRRVVSNYGNLIICLYVIFSTRGAHTAFKNIMYGTMAPRRTSYHITPHTHTNAHQHSRTKSTTAPITKPPPHEKKNMGLGTAMHSPMHILRIWLYDKIWWFLE